MTLTQIPDDEGLLSDNDDEPNCSRDEADLALPDMLPPPQIENANITVEEPLNQGTLEFNTLGCCLKGTFLN